MAQTNFEKLFGDRTTRKVHNKANKAARKAGIKAGAMSAMIGASVEGDRAYNKSVKKQGYKLKRGNYKPILEQKQTKKKKK